MEKNFGTLSATRNKWCSLFSRIVFTDRVPFVSSWSFGTYLLGRSFRGRIDLFSRFRSSYPPSLLPSHPSASGQVSLCIITTVKVRIHGSFPLYSESQKKTKKKNILFICEPYPVLIGLQYSLFGKVIEIVLS